MEMREKNMQVTLLIRLRRAGQTEIANPGPRVEDEALSACDLYFDAGSIAADAQIFGRRCGHRAARAPYAHFHRRNGWLRRHATIHCYSAWRRFTCEPSLHRRRPGPTSRAIDRTDRPGP